MTGPTKSANTDRIAEATGYAWDDWVAFLDDQDGRELPHPVLADLAHARLNGSVDNAGWWAQGVTVAYEQHIGRRLPGQRADGSFEVSMTKRRAGGMNAALDAWLAAVEGWSAIDGIAYDGKPRHSVTDKWRRWRVALADGSKVEVDINEPKGDGALVAVTSKRLDSPAQIESRRAFFRPMLEGLSPRPS